MYHSTVGAIVCITEKVFAGEITERQAFQELVGFQEEKGILDYDLVFEFIPALAECKNGLNLQCVQICARLMARF